MKNDMRITYPLWQLAFIVLFFVFVLFLSATFEFNIFPDGGFELSVHLTPILYPIVLFFVMIGLTIMFFVKVKRHNRHMPKHKINLFSLKPPEYVEDDEFFQDVTRRATQKVYSYYTWAMPLIVTVYVLVPVISRKWMILGLLVVAAFQYIIYYRTIKKYVTDED